MVTISGNRTVQYGSPASNAVPRQPVNTLISVPLDSRSDSRTLLISEYVNIKIGTDAKHWKQNTNSCVSCWPGNRISRRDTVQWLLNNGYNVFQTNLFEFIFFMVIIFRANMSPGALCHTYVV